MKTAHVFTIVIREKDFKPFETRPNRDGYGWELADGIEITGYQEASRMMREYALAMPSHVVRLRVIRN